MLYNDPLVTYSDARYDYFGNVWVTPPPSITINSRVVDAIMNFKISEMFHPILKTNNDTINLKIK
jgi:hypothetical protein